MPLVMSFTNLQLQAHWLQQQPLIYLVQTQSYFSHLVHGQPLLAQHRFNIWWLLVAVVVDITLVHMVALVVVAQEDLKLLQDYL
jgi:hypothetical protein